MACFSHERPFSVLGYEVIYTAVPAIGRLALPPPSRSRISPPVPVAAPLNGSTVVGKLWVSALSEITVLIFFISKKSGLSWVAGANCSISGPSLNATLSLYADIRRLGLYSEVFFISLNKELSFFSPLIINNPLKIL